MQLLYAEGVAVEESGDRQHTDGYFWVRSRRNPRALHQGPVFEERDPVKGSSCRKSGERRNLLVSIIDVMDRDTGQAGGPALLLFTVAGSRLGVAGVLQYLRGVVCSATRVLKAIWSTRPV